jgi:hypothetical protein
MAEDTQIDELSWSVFIDRLAGPLRLERPDRKAYGLLMTLHLVGAIWGDLALLRGAARLSARHHFDLEPVCAAPEGPRLEAWYRGFLAHHAGGGHAGETALAPLPQSLLKPAWTAEQQNS